MGWGQWTGEQPKAHEEEAAESSIGNDGGEKLRGEWKGATIGEEDCGVIPRHARAAGVGTERWVWHVVIVGRRMAAAERGRKEPQEKDPKAPVKA
jgi:hypothetical protein